MLGSVHALPLGPSKNATVATSAAVRHHVANVLEHCAAFLRGTVLNDFGNESHIAENLDFFI